MPRIGLDFVLKHGSDVRDPFPSPHPWYVLFELSSPREGEELTRLAETVLGEGLASREIDGTVIASSLAQAAGLWRLRELMSEVQKHEGGSIKHDVAVPVARVPEFIARANQLVELMIPGARPVPFGHLGDGNIHYNVSQPPGMDRVIFLSSWETLNAAVHEIVLDLGGSISAEHGIGRLKRDLLPHAKPPIELELMRKIKAAFDPERDPQSRKAVVMKRLETDELWTAVDDYIDKHLVGEDEALQAALEASVAAGLPRDQRLGQSGQASDAARAVDRRAPHPRDRHARRLQHDLARARASAWRAAHIARARSLDAPRSRVPISTAPASPTASRSASAARSTLCRVLPQTRRSTSSSSTPTSRAHRATTNGRSSSRAQAR